ncbi:hypothetical protein PF010_g23661 [Phytophthora fragariae]|uniref:Uncharacterized protein n=1 Tax=Phytophthora fragariae TaxID=53985 RepID=A0A6G0K5Q4_9STRA|nr:hypothetical protein PF010_g23661 [Phytophthora fragariae]
MTPARWQCRHECGDVETAERRIHSGVRSTGKQEASDGEEHEDRGTQCAPFPLCLAAASKDLMTELCRISTGLAPGVAGSPAPSLRRVSSLPDIRSPCCVEDSRAATVPEPTSEVTATQRLHQGILKTKSSSGLRPLKLKVARRPQGRKSKTLFHSDYVLLAEYVECVLPLLYAVYLSVLHHLPTAAYYPHMHSLTGDKFSATLQNLLLYALIEFSSFAGVSLLLKRKFGFSPLYQLAFVLETQARALQSQLLIWVLCILQFTLVHNGVNLDVPFKKQKF